MREKAQILDEFWLKIIAFFTMTLDHIGMYLMDHYLITSSPGYQVGSVFRMIGRIAFPIFVFMLAEGLRYSKNRGKYLFRIFIMWSLVFVVDLTMYVGFKINPSFLGGQGGDLFGQAFTDILLLGLMIYLFEHPKKELRPLAILPLTYLVWCYIAGILAKQGVDIYTYFPRFLSADYSLFGLFIFLGFYYAYRFVDFLVTKYLVPSGTSLEEYRKTKNYRGMVNAVGVSVLLAVSLIFWGISYINDTAFDPFQRSDFRIQNYCILACFILILYNGKRGYDSKGFRIGEYIYYPLHIAVIALVFALL